MFKKITLYNNNNNNITRGLHNKHGDDLLPTLLGNETIESGRLESRSPLMNHSVYSLGRSFNTIVYEDIVSY